MEELCLNLQIAFGWMAIFTILVLPIHQHRWQFHLLESSFISFFSVLKFSLCKVFKSFVRFSPCHCYSHAERTQGFVIKLTSSDLSLYLQIITSFSPCQNSCNQVAINTETHKPAKVQRIRDCRVPSSKWNIWIITFSDNTQGSSEKVGRIVRARGGECLPANSVSQTQQVGCIYELTTVVTTCISLYKLKSDKMPAWKRQVGMNSHPQLRRYWQFPASEK